MLSTLQAVPANGDCPLSGPAPFSPLLAPGLRVGGFTVVRRVFVQPEQQDGDQDMLGDDPGENGHQWLAEAGEPDRNESQP